MSQSAAETSIALVGLTIQEAAARLDQFGPHEPAAAPVVRGKAIDQREGVWPTT
jgi:hypothetical protein